MESCEGGLFTEHTNLEFCKEMRLFVECFFCFWPASSLFFVCISFLYCITDKHFNM